MGICVHDMHITRLGGIGGLGGTTFFTLHPIDFGLFDWFVLIFPLSSAALQL